MTESPARLPSAVLRLLHIPVCFAAVQQDMAAWPMLGRPQSRVEVDSGPLRAAGACTVQCERGLRNALELSPPGSLKSDSHKG